ncbi:hypothetical protein L4X63_11970 [Geomonas sp. Red32]|uniref:hypothetical protein n=1 Tax=Geomonas sp. Red32 TaxID=2912856 RepID=UPI00202CBB91|nr:hypothetical protein [Geomonas sp. Red32]MCM0082306.1 hypothetical protein [Geomonas sp. Red32]
MGQPKAKTLIEKFGFKDDDLKTPEHDSIMIWLNANIEEVINRAFPAVWPEREVKGELSDFHTGLAKLKASLERQLHNLRSSSAGPGAPTPDPKTLETESKLLQLEEWSKLEDPPAMPKLQVTKTVWECTIMNDKGFVVGAIDMMVRVRRPGLRVESYTSNLQAFPSAAPEWRIGSYDDEVFIEVKSKILSLGELIRQIRFYQSHKRGSYVVVSPDDRFAEILRNQGIGFVPCPSFSQPKPVQGNFFS